MSDEKKKLEARLNAPQKDVENLFDALRSRESRELSKIEQSLEYWSVGKGRDMLDYISERYDLGIGNRDDLEVCLSDNLRFNVADISIEYSSCEFEREAKGDLFYSLTDSDSPDRAEGDSESFVITKFDPETSTGTSYRGLSELITLLIEEGLSSSKFNNKMNEHVIITIGGEYPPSEGNMEKNEIYTRLSQRLNYSLLDSDKHKAIESTDDLIEYIKAKTINDLIDDSTEKV